MTRVFIFLTAQIHFSHFPSQIHHAAINIITVWWLFKPDSAFTLTTEVCAAPPAPVPRKHTQTRLKRTTSAGDAATSGRHSVGKKKQHCEHDAYLRLECLSMWEIRAWFNILSLLTD